MRIHLIKESYHDAGQVSKNAACSAGEPFFTDQAERQCSGYSGQAAKMRTVTGGPLFDARYARLSSYSMLG